MGSALILCGIKHCGKSTLGRGLAALLRVPFRDTDELLEKAVGIPVRTFFREAGETAFRLRETEMLKTLSGESPQVISLGGGALEKEENASLVRELGTLIWCDTDEETAFRRVLRRGLPPFLADSPDPRKEFSERNRVRRALFARLCDVRFVPVPGVRAEENVRNLRRLLQEKGIIGQ